jgi:hypothetical protein
MIMSAAKLGHPSRTPTKFIELRQGSERNGVGSEAGLVGLVVQAIRQDDDWW